MKWLNKRNWIVRITGDKILGNERGFFYSRWYFSNKNMIILWKCDKKKYHTQKISKASLILKEQSMYG